MLLKGLPLAYNKDLQESQEPLFAAADTAQRMTALLGRFTAALHFNTDRMRAACETGFLNAMAAATYLVHKGVPFRNSAREDRPGRAVWFGEGLRTRWPHARRIKAVRARIRSRFFLPPSPLTLP